VLKILLRREQQENVTISLHYDIIALQFFLLVGMGDDLDGCGHGHRPMMIYVSIKSKSSRSEGDRCDSPTLKSYVNKDLYQS
jgi:hypothetical protein